MPEQANMTVDQVKELITISLEQGKIDTAVGILMNCIVSLHKELTVLKEKVAKLTE